MQDYQQQFIQYALDCGVLKFGEFQLKSGRISPYFFNTGLFNTGAQLDKLGQFYAQALLIFPLPLIARKPRIMVKAVYWWARLCKARCGYWMM